MSPASIPRGWPVATKTATRLLLGRYQLTQTVETAAAKAADWRLALVHHPWEDLAEFDRHAARDTVHRHCDVLLRGHLHHPHPEHIRQPERNCLELPTGCVYETSQYPNAFQWIELSAPPAKRVRVRFCLWHEGAWKVDKLRGNDGWWEVELTDQQPAKHSPKTAPPVADVGKYLEDLWTDTAYIDIRGLATGRPEANRFPIEDLYIELGATSDAGEAPEARTARLDRRETPLKAALQNQRLVIIGDPGCGKTTFLRWVAHCLAGDRLGKAADAARTRLGLDRARLPILVSIAAWLDFIETRERRNAGTELKAGAGWLPEYLAARAADAGQGSRRRGVPHTARCR